jgi:thymidylate synthase (FAD)
MKRVHPKVRLIAKPQIDWVAVDQYLTDIRGNAWMDRLRAYGDDHDIDGRAGEYLTEFGGRLCYRSWEPGLNPNVTKVREDHDDYLENILRSLHGSVVEHANYSFVFQDVSRVLTHELIRHRAGCAYSQESMRFVRLTDIPFWFPDWALEDEQLVSRSEHLLRLMEDHQQWMAGHFGLDEPGVPFHEKKAKTSFMRRFAPDGVATSILATFNIRAIRWIIQQRTDAGAEEEIRLVFDKVAHIMTEEAPALMVDFKRSEDGVWSPDYKKV